MGKSPLIKFLNLRNLLAGVARNRDGATAIEYGLIAALIFLAIVVSVNLFADSMGNMFNTIANNVEPAL